MNTKKSKFQERLNEAYRKHTNPEEDSGSINDEVKLHEDKFFTRAASEVSRGKTSQTAQDPMDIKLYSIRDIDTIITLIEDKLIPNIEMPQTGNDAHLGYNTAIRECLTLLKRISMETKLKLHKRT